MNRWLARLALSFFVIAAVLFWKAYQQWQLGPQWDLLVAEIVGGLAATVMGVIGTRARHRL